MIGDLNKRITIQAPTKASDGMGGFTVTWSDIGTVYGAVWPVSAKERIQNSAISTTISHRIRIRYRRVFRTGWRILYRGRYFNIVSIIDPNEAHEWLDILCEEAK
jgi:SPP1 family predicted phage head-tail adaptor